MYCVLDCNLVEAAKIQDRMLILSATTMELKGCGWRYAPSLYNLTMTLQAQFKTM